MKKEFEPEEESDRGSERLLEKRRISIATRRIQFEKSELKIYSSFLRYAVTLWYLDEKQRHDYILRMKPSLMDPSTKNISHEIIPKFTDKEKFDIDSNLHSESRSNEPRQLNKMEVLENIQSENKTEISSLKHDASPILKSNEETHSNDKMVESTVYPLRNKEILYNYLQCSTKLQCVRALLNI